MQLLGTKMHRLVSKLNRSNSNISESQCEEVFYHRSESPPRDVPKGCLAIYVGLGNELHRYVVGTHMLGNPLFKALLDRTADEYGFNPTGALTIPCDAVLFEHFMWLLGKNDPTATQLEVDELLNFYNA